MSEQRAPYSADHADVYQRLAAEFEVTFRDLRGGVELEYITGEQATTRLNENLGFLAWSFRIVEHGIHAEADECWVLGEMTATIGERTVTRQQFGSQKIKRSRSSGTPLDIGFDLKGAGTDALKKCASLLGVGLYLWKKDPPAATAGTGRAASGAPTPLHPRSAPSGEIQVNEDGVPVCQIDRNGQMCGKPVSGWDASGSYQARDPMWVAEWQIKKAEYGMPLCIGHQQGIKSGAIQAIRWQPREAPDVGGGDLPPWPDDSDLPF